MINPGGLRSKPEYPGRLALHLSVRFSGSGNHLVVRKLNYASRFCAIAWRNDPAVLGGVA